MATMTIRISEELISDPPPATLGGSIQSDDNCEGTWNISAKTLGTAWVEWTTTGANVLVTGGTNGETINNETKTYFVTIDGYKSQNQSQNTVFSSATFYLKDAQGGNVLDTKTVGRYHTNQNC